MRNINDPEKQFGVERLEAKTTELNKLREEFQKAQHEFDMKSNQMSSENNTLKKKVMDLTERQKVAMSLNSKTMNGIIEMHKKALEDTTNGLKKVKEELQVAEINNLAFSKRIIQELNLASNQFSSKTPKKEATDAKKTPAKTLKRLRKGCIQFEDLKVGNSPEAASRKMYYKTGALLEQGKL